MRVPFEYSVVGRRKGRRSIQLHHTRSTVDVEVRDLSDTASGPLVIPTGYSEAVQRRRIASGRIWTPVEGLQMRLVDASNIDAFVDELLRVNAIDRLIGPRNAFRIRSMSYFDTTDRKKSFEPGGTEFQDVRFDDRSQRSQLAADGASDLAWIDGTLHASTHLPVLRLVPAEGPRQHTTLVDMQRLLHVPGRRIDTRPSVSLREMRRLCDEGSLPAPPERINGHDWRDLARMLDDEGVEQEIPTREYLACTIYSQIAALVGPRTLGMDFGESGIASTDVPEDLDDALNEARRLTRDIDRRLDLRLDASDLVQPLEGACTRAFEIVLDLISLRRPDALRWGRISNRECLDDVSFGMDVLRAKLALAPRPEPTRIRADDHKALGALLA